MLVGDPGEVRGLEDEVTERLGERLRQGVDLYIRSPGDGPGAKFNVMKKAMVILMGVGDVERSRVCLLLL